MTTDHNPDAREVEASERRRFETVISGPPYELGVRRRPNDNTTAWPGNYVDYRVDLAWAIWQEAVSTRAPLPEVDAAVVLPPMSGDLLDALNELRYPDLTQAILEFAEQSVQADRQSRAQQPTREAETRDERDALQLLIDVAEMLEKWPKRISGRQAGLMVRGYALSLAAMSAAPVTGSARDEGAERG